VSTYEMIVNGAKFVVEVGDVSASPVQVTVNGEAKIVEFRGGAAAPMVAAAPVVAAAPAAKPAPVAARKVAPPAEGTTIVAPMPGKILSVRVKVGASVKEGDTVCTLEAMKMEMPIAATTSGKVIAVEVSVGDTVSNGDPLVTVA
jgi:glutaconyl-CoA/methylmalonyl-CoA decarboxylase subunit gamma